MRHAVFALTILLGAGLLFLVEPMAAKALLPVLGGSAAVWTASLIFFQTVLLGGYGWAHVLAHTLSPRRAAFVHAAAVLVAVALLPWHGFSFVSSGGPGMAAPWLWVLGALAASIGVPFFVLASTGPLLQRWMIELRTGHDPMSLNALGNASSLAALVAYPCAVERLRAPIQVTLWCGGFVFYAATSLACAACVVPLSVRPTPASPARGDLPSSWRHRALWAGLAAAASATMLATTQALTTDIASVPMLWALTLATYLATFVLAFGWPERLPIRVISWTAAAGVICVLATKWKSEGALDPRVALPLHLGTLFAIGLLCHGRLVLTRPASQELTSFYLCVAGGGTLGSVACGVLAPAIFLRVEEFPIALAIASLLALRPLGFALGIGALSAGSVLWSSGTGGDLWAARTFYGSLRVRDEPGPAFVPTGGPHAGQEIRFAMHRLYHGTTLHGVQVTREAERRLPTAYYHPSGPIGRVFEGLRAGPQAAGLAEVAVVGLGVGALAAYAQPGEHFTFFEIDPGVVQIARNPALFTFVSDSAGVVDIVLGDGRLGLAAKPDGQFGLIVIDAFSSDAVPVHLLTRESLSTALRKLRPGGVVAYHLSSRFFDLAPVLAEEASSLGRPGLFWDDEELPTIAAVTGKWPSSWAVVAEARDDLAGIERSGHWVPLESQRRRDQGLWTDEYSNPLAILK